MDGILGLLLLVAIMIGLRLDKKLVALRSAHEGFAKAVAELDDAAIRAHASLKELRTHADESQDLLHGRVIAARDALQKLDLQIARAERVQRDLDKGLVTFDALQSVRAQPAPVPTPAPIVRPEPVREATALRVQAGRRPFDRDMVRDDAPVKPRQSLLPEVKEADESEIIDKVQMSELVVANLNEMIRTLNLPKRQVLSVEDDLFGDAGQPK
jgi:hypothetical protein